MSKWIGVVPESVSIASGSDRVRKATVEMPFLLVRVADD